MNKFSAMLWNISKEPPFSTLDAPSIEDLLISEAYMGNTDKMKWLKTNLTISREEIQQVDFLHLVNIYIESEKYFRVFE